MAHNLSSSRYSLACELHQGIITSRIKDQVKVPCTAARRRLAGDVSALESKIGKPDRFVPDITVEVEFEDKTYRRKSAFLVMIEKILTEGLALSSSL